MKRWLVVLAVWGLATAIKPVSWVQAQAVQSIVPEHDYILALTQQRAATSVLGDLQQRQVDSSDIELRFWGGYGLTGTRGLVLRRTAGRWQAWRATVRTCNVLVPASIGDTLTPEGETEFLTHAKRYCGTRFPRGKEIARIVGLDTLLVVPLSSSRDYASIWRAAVQRGLLALPPRPARKWTMLDGFTYVVEVRRGPEYRASVIEQVRPPELEADRQVQLIDDLLRTRIGW